MGKTYEYDLPFTAHTEEIGTLYQYLLESYEQLDYDAVENYGRKLIEAMKEDVADRSTPTEEDERAERGEREMELARDMERCQ